MKKAYSTPDIVFDSFALNENIANVNMHCTKRLANLYSGACGMEWKGRIVFITTASGCKFKVPDGSAMCDGLCYEVPVADMRIFNS